MPFAAFLILRFIEPLSPQGLFAVMPHRGSSARNRLTLKL